MSDKEKVVYLNEKFKSGTDNAEEITSQTVLTAALEHKFEHVMVIGWLEEGPLFFSSTTGYTPDNMTLLDLTKHGLLTLYVGEN